MTVDEWADFVRFRLAKIKKGRQTGLDAIPDEFYVAAGDDGQWHLAGLLCRASAEGPPFAWRGGWMWAAPRKATSPLSPANSRALLCADHKAKHFAAAIRKALVPYLQSVAQGNQSGAIPKGGTEFPMFIAKQFLHLAELQKNLSGFGVW